MQRREKGDRGKLGAEGELREKGKNEENGERRGERKK